MAHMRRTSAGCRTATQVEQLLSVLLLAGCLMVSAQGRGGGGGARAGGGVRTTTTPVVTRPVVQSRYVTGSSIGYSTSYPLRGVVVASALVWYGGHTYPAVRFHYDGYYDDCALRNVTEAAQVNGTDYVIDLDTVNQLPTTVPYNPTTDNIITYNATLYNETGLIIDAPYCNYTEIGDGGGSGGVRAVGALWYAVWAVAGMAVAIAVAQMG